MGDANDIFENEVNGWQKPPSRAIYDGD